MSSTSSRQLVYQNDDIGSYFGIAATILLLGNIGTNGIPEVLLI